MCVNSLIIKSNIKNYQVNFELNDDFIKSLANTPNTVFVIDENVYAKHKDGTLKSINRDKIIILEVREEKKNIESVCELYSKIMQFKPRKNLNLVSIGGGITQDITGFVASSLYRGVNWIFIPTTLLAQVDSCIGAKTSLNFKSYKNLIGTFYPPSKIYIYPDFLKTLLREDYYSGIGEMAKLHLMAGKAHTEIFIESLASLDALNPKVLLDRTQNCLAIKKSYIEEDEFDSGKRNMLNYGHCFGHAIESSSDFGISHGQAVVLGMIIANKMALKIGVLSSQNEEFIRKNVLEPSFVVDIPDFCIKKTIEAMGQDKKNLGTGLALVMLKDNYDMLKITDMTQDSAKELLIECLK